MFGLEKLFGGKDATDVNPGEEKTLGFAEGIQDKESDIYGLLEPFSKLVPSVEFTADNIMEIVALAKLSDDEIAMVSGAMHEGIIDENDELDPIREKLIVAAKMYADGIRE